MSIPSSHPQLCLIKGGESSRKDVSAARRLYIKKTRCVKNRISKKREEKLLDFFSGLLERKNDEDFSVKNLIRLKKEGARSLLGGEKEVN